MISMAHKLAAPAAAAVLSLSVASANAALVSTSPSCVISILNPDYTACGGSFAGNVTSLHPQARDFQRRFAPPKFSHTPSPCSAVSPMPRAHSSGNHQLEMGT